MSDPPEKLTTRDRWVCWRYEMREGEKTKPPIAPFAGQTYASTKDEDTWRSYESTVRYHARRETETEGVGYVLGDGDMVAGADLDGCRDPATGEIEPWAQEVIERLDSYTEISPSGTGLRVFVIALMPDGRNRKEQPRTIDSLKDCVKESELELYDDGRYLTFTGDHLEGTPTTVEQRNSAFKSVHDEFLGDDDESAEKDTPTTPEPVDIDLSDEQLLTKARAAENGDKFQALESGSDALHGGDTSAADQAFCNLLAFWTGGDRMRMDSLFRNSSRMRTKWDEDRGDQTYGELTIEQAVSTVSEYYDPQQPATDGGATVSPPPQPQGLEEENPPARVDSSTLVQSITDSPDDWFDLDSQTVSVRGTEDYTPTESRDLFEDGPDEFPDAEKADLLVDLEDDSLSAFQDWIKSPDNWTVEIAREDSPWTKVRNWYQHDNTRDDARYKATNLTEESFDIATERKSERMYVYDPQRGVYQEDGDSKLRTYLDGKMGAQAKRSRVTNILFSLESRTFVDADELGGPERLVCTRNGVLNIENEELTDFDPDHRFLSHLGTDFDPNAECPQWMEFLGEAVRPEDIAGLQEYIGYCLMHWDQPYKKALLLLGPKNSGKSTFLNVVNELLGGRDNVASESLHDIVDGRWGAARLHGKYANIYSDLDASVVENSGRFKTIVGNDKQIAAEFKGKDKFDFEPVQKLLFSANRVPKAKDADGAFYDRWLHATFPNSVPESDQDPELEEKLLTELPGILNWALEGYHRIVDRKGRFSGERSVDKKQEFWDAYGDSIRRFKHNCLDVSGDADEFEATEEVYNAYLRFCDSLGVDKKTKTMLTRELKKDDKISRAQRTIDGSRQHAYKGVSLNEHAEQLEENEEEEHSHSGLNEF